MYVRTRVVLVVLTAVGVSFVANAQQPAGDPAPAVSPAAEAAPAVEPVPAVDPAPAPINNEQPAVDSQAAGAPLPVAAPAETTPSVAAPTSTTTIAATQTATERVPRAFHGSTLGYSHSITALTLAPGAEGHYNPTWGHRLAIAPEWHFNDQLFVRAKLFLYQEFTTSDTTTYDHEVELSDIWLDVGATGITEPKTGLHLGADVRFLIPTSKASQYATRIITVGPSLTLSRDFNILHGLNIAYIGRFTYRFNRSNTPQGSVGLITNVPCTGLDTVECNVSGTHFGVQYDFAHGPNITFNPLEKLSFNAFFSWYHLELAPMGADPAKYAGSTQLAQRDDRIRNFAVSGFSASWELFKPVSLSIGTFTITPQPSPDGTYLQPLFNRNTTLYLDATFDIEAAAASFL